MPRLLRITTVPISLHLLLQGQFGYMREHGFEVIAMSADGKEASDVVKDGTPHIIIPMTRKITPLQDLKCLWMLIQEIKKIRPDIVHTHTPKAGLLGMIASWICRVPVRLHTVAGLPLMEATGLKRRVLGMAESVTYACAHVVFPNSLGLKKFIEHHFRIAPNKVRILGNGSSNGIDTVFFDRSPELENRAFQLRADYNIGKRDIVFSFVGRIVSDKGIVELVHAFRQLTGSNNHGDRNIFLLLVGHFEEELDPLPVDILDFLKNNKHVILSGFQSDIRPWIIASDVFVLPSYREGFPNVVMQAGLLRVPCIVSDINGCNEIVKDGSTGVVVQVKNVSALVQAMEKMMDDEFNRKRLADAARDFVASTFKRELIWDALLNEYNELLKSRTEAKTFKVH